jgi:chemotaxis protein histidine kinase CheA
MPSALQHADPQSDQNDAIVELLRNHASRIANDPSELNITPIDHDKPAAAAPSIEPPLRATPLNDNIGAIHEPIPRARRGRGLTRVLLTVCVGAAATIGWHSYGEEAKQKLAHLAPLLLAGASTSTQPANAAEPQDAASQTAATATQQATEPAPTQAATEPPPTPAQPATAATPPEAGTAPAQAANLSPELAQSIDTMAREIASLKQTVEQLKAGQQQLSRDVAKAAEHETRRKPATQVSKPASPPQAQRAPIPPPYAAAAPRPPAPYPPPRTYPQAQTYPQGQTYPQNTVQRETYIPPPPAPTRLPPEPGYSSAPRPPMPLQ